MDACAFLAAKFGGVIDSRRDLASEKLNHGFSHTHRNDFGVRRTADEIVEAFRVALTLELEFSARQNAQRARTVTGVFKGTGFAGIMRVVPRLVVHEIPLKVSAQVQWHYDMIRIKAGVQVGDANDASVRR